MKILLILLNSHIFPISLKSSREMISYIKKSRKEKLQDRNILDYLLKLQHILNLLKISFRPKRKGLKPWKNKLRR